MFHLSHGFVFALMLVLMIATFFLFERLDRQFDIKIRYFSFVCKKKWLYYIIFLMWLLLFTALLIISHLMNHGVYRVIIVLCFCIFINLYHHVRNWQMAYNVYIKHIDLLRKAKEREKKKYQK